MTIETDDREKILNEKLEKVKKALEGITIEDACKILQKTHTDLMNKAMSTKV